MELLQVPTAAPLFVAVALVPGAAWTAFLMGGLLLAPYYSLPVLRAWRLRRRRAP